MSPYLALAVYLATLVYIAYNLLRERPISRLDYFGASISYFFFGLAWVIERFQA